MEFSKEVLKESLTLLLQKVGSAIITLIRTKLLPKAIEKQCEALKDGSEKFLDKVGDIIDEFKGEKDETKKFRKLFLLELCVNTMAAIADTFGEAANQIRAGVDFSPLHEDNEAVRVALADIDTSGLDDSGGCHCGPDGCMIV